MAILRSKAVKSRTKAIVLFLLMLITIAWFALDLSEGDIAEALVLKQGSQGQAVKDVQQKLKQWGYYNGSVDGIFGAATKKAVIYFQQKNGLSADGVVGDNTLKALGLNKYVGSGGGGGSAAQSDKVNLLARAIWAEAEAEPYIGKVAVGAVLLNRVGHGDFPNTLSGVIYQSLAIESVANGRLTAKTSNESVKAAKDAINGWDPTYGCLYFWNPKTATSPWIWTRKIVVKYGEHVFGI